MLLSHKVIPTRFVHSRLPVATYVINKQFVGRHFEIMKASSSFSNFYPLVLTSIVDFPSLPFLLYFSHSTLLFPITVIIIVMTDSMIISYCFVLVVYSFIVVLLLRFCPNNYNF